MKTRLLSGLGELVMVREEWLLKEFSSAIRNRKEEIGRRKDRLV